MSIILGVFAILAIQGIVISRPNEFHGNYLSKRQTTIINGVFVGMVFLSHLTQYLPQHSEYDGFYITIQSFLKQAVVVTFLGFSGFGMMESIKSKQANYIKKIPIRGLKLLIQYDLVVILFLVVNLVIGRTFSLKKIVLSLTSITSVGNSNWYVFAIFIAYFIIFISFSLIKKKPKIALLVAFILTISYMYIAMNLGLASRYYNTIICLPVGMLYSMFKDKIDKFINSDIKYSVVLSIILVLLIKGNSNMNTNIFYYSLFMIAFLLFIIFIMKKIEFNSVLLEWLGSHVFSIYILQRIPMILLKDMNLHTNFLTFFTLSLMGTVILSLMFDKYIVPKVNKLFQN